MGSALFSAILIFALFVFASLAIDRVLARISRRFDTDSSELFRLFSNSQKAVLVFIGTMLALAKLGFDVSALVASLGLTGFALGFALKDAIANLVAGAMIVLYRPVAIGDLVEIAGSKGTVSNINLRYITLETPGCTNLIPNSLLLSNKLAIFSETETGGGPAL